MIVVKLVGPQYGPVFGSGRAETVNENASLPRSNKIPTDISTIFREIKNKNIRFFHFRFKGRQPNRKLISEYFRDRADTQCSSFAQYRNHPGAGRDLLVIKRFIVKERIKSTCSRNEQPWVRKQDRIVAGLTSFK